ncbi:MAG: FtsW/RodA/SpoVE family cell cycle protein [Chloroflexota bacterium]
MSDRGGRRLLALATAFVFAQGLILMLSPAVRERSWAASLKLSHWLGIFVWLVTMLVLQRLLEHTLPNRDPFALALCALLSGWGVVTIWRLDPTFGLRQTAWLVVSAAAVIWLVGRWDDLTILRRYKYVLLGGGLILTALTIILGTSPTGAGPRLWLGCCGVYLQPSEPLKLLLVLYLAAYLADQVQLRTRTFPLLLPTVLVAGLALLLLLVQRDLGSASIFILLYTIILYVATERRRVLIATVVALGLAAATGFLFVDVIQARLESWLNPWTDPSGRSYQIIQSLLSIANGGIVGRGLGLGSPGLVPVSHSDFIYSAIAEESGLAGSLGLLAAYALLFTRGLVVSLRSPDRFHRLLAAGLTAYLGIQGLLIIGGDLRMLPLTGVTLPFVSYGGSSLLTSSVAVAMLVTISNHSNRKPAPVPSPVPYVVLGGLLATGIVAAALIQSWWAIVRGPDLLARTDNARRAIADRYVLRGSLLDRDNSPINLTAGESGSLRRMYVYPDLGPIIGYTHPAFGQAGLEASLDPYLRGTQGNPVSLLLWDQLLYGTPPQGLDVRLTIDLSLQENADASLGNLTGAIVLMNAHSGEILVMASHPTYDANDLDVIGAGLLQHAGAPLLNRAAQGTYGLHQAALPLRTAAGVGSSEADTDALYEALGFHSPPRIRMPVSDPYGGAGTGEVRVSPLQLTAAAAALSNEGVRPSPRIALAVNTPRQGWVVLPALGEAQAVVSAEAADQAALHYAVAPGAIWQWRVGASSPEQVLTWYVAGTLPDWQGTPLVVVVLLESGDVSAATKIGSGLLEAAASP